LISGRRLREKQKAMRERPRKARPWDHVNEDQAEQFIFRLRKMSKAGMTDEFIGHALNLDPVFVQVLRNKRSTQG
jgi:hypothetical protein